MPIRWLWLRGVLERRRRSGQGKEDPGPRWSERGIEMRAGAGEPIEIGWAEIRKVFAYKMDCYGYDQLRLVFVSERGMTELAEDAEDFLGLVRVAGRELGTDEGWLVELLGIPSFDGTWRLLYTRQSETGEVR